MALCREILQKKTKEYTKDDTDRLTQHGHKINTMEDLTALYEKSFSDDTVTAISKLSHPTVQKFAVITIAIVGASRRFLAQITKHQNEVKFMSASLQYSNYAGQTDFAIPYEVLTAPKAIQEMYLESCKSDMDCYEELCATGIGHDAAGYATPQNLRNVLIISATPYQWKYHRPAGMPDMCSPTAIWPLKGWSANCLL